MPSILKKLYQNWIQSHLPRIWKDNYGHKILFRLIFLNSLLFIKKYLAMSSNEKCKWNLKLYRGIGRKFG